MTRPRDTQRSKLYAAERVAFPRSADEGRLSLEECQAYVDRVVGSASWKGQFEERRSPFGVDTYARVTVKDGRGSGAARCISYFEISVPTDMRREWILLHELAHVATQRLYGWNEVPWHGWEYATVYLGLVRRWLGADAHDRLRAAFRAGKVRYNAPRQGRPLTPEQREAAIARLAAYRQNAATKESR